MCLKSDTFQCCFSLMYSFQLWIYIAVCAIRVINHFRVRVRHRWLGPCRQKLPEQFLEWKHGQSDILSSEYYCIGCVTSQSDASFALPYRTGREGIYTLHLKCMNIRPVFVCFQGGGDGGGNCGVGVGVGVGVGRVCVSVDVNISKILIYIYK